MSVNETVNMKLAMLKMNKQITNYKMSNRKGKAIAWDKEGNRYVWSYAYIIKNF